MAEAILGDLLDFSFISLNFSRAMCVKSVNQSTIIDELYKETDKSLRISKIKRI